VSLLRSIRRDSDRPDRHIVAVFIVIVVCLWCARFTQMLVPQSWSRLSELNWWAGTQIVFYAVVPVAGLAAIGVRPVDLGWRFSGIMRHGWVYAGLFAIALPFVIVVSGSMEFQEHYPILEIVPGQTDVWRDLAIWWPFYALQFVAIETFFRGVLVLGLSERFGSSAVLIAVVPYMMIHFVKPPAEAAASIVGGVVLGYLALRTRSIVWGIALHIAVAASMDIAALGHKGFVW
jgi:uncharacterized protein